jgi:predicted secreted protein
MAFTVAALRARSRTRDEVAGMIISPLKRLLPVLTIAALTGTAAAQEPDDADRGTRIVLDEEAVREVEQDTLVAMLTARGETDNPRDAQAAVNAAIQAAIAASDSVEGLRRATGGYRVYQRYDRKGEPTGWVAEQDLRLTTGAHADLLDLVGTLQDEGLLLRGLVYELSREAREALEDELTAEALTRLRERAVAIAGTLGAEVERIARLRIGGVGSPPPVMPQMMEMRAVAQESMAPPSALPDRETVRVQVEGEVVLSP